MSNFNDWGWPALFLLGAYHGINPGMGWLFAVALGMQERSSRAVWRALPPIALGHGISIAAMVAVAALVQVVISFWWLKVAMAGLLVALGLLRLVRSRHPRFGGMQVGFRDLTIWSFLMASAHGAGLMVLPILYGAPLGEGAPSASGHHLGMVSGQMGLLAVLVHTAGYLIVTGFVAWVVYEKLGLALLRRAWLNLDLLWSLALIATGLLVLLI
ncbi:MAG TPA: hypothetical protein VLV83_09810 [Acidobacteriota bacterium]|nr:hypothetical protein [Acidobacteriota bacterium]